MRWEFLSPRWLDALIPVHSRLTLSGRLSLFLP